MQRPRFFFNIVLALLPAQEPLVESLRSIAELLAWGDKHDPAFFEFFLENNMMGQFMRLLGLRSAVRGGVSVQLLQVRQGGGGWKGDTP